MVVGAWVILHVAMSSNPFSNVGGIITGGRFLGRAQHLRFIRERMFSAEGFASVAIIGMSRVGKSSLAAQAILHDPPTLSNEKLIAFRLTLDTYQTSHEMFQGIVQTAWDKISISGHLATEIQEQAQRVRSATAEEQWHEVQRFFRLTRRSRLRIVCVLDEFDSGRKLFDGGPHCFCRLRTLASELDCQVGLVLVSRRELSEVSRLAGHASNYWANILKPINLCCFDQTEMEQYYQKLDEAGLHASPNLRAELDEVCGGHPWLIDWFASALFQRADPTAPIQPDQARQILSVQLTELFRDIVQQLREDAEFDRVRACLLGMSTCQNKALVMRLRNYGLLVNRPEGKTRAFAITFADYLNQDCRSSNVRSAVTKKAQPPTEELPASGPFEFDWADDSLVRPNGFKIYLPRRFAAVLREMLRERRELLPVRKFATKGADGGVRPKISKPLRQYSRKTVLTFLEVSELYLGAKVEEGKLNAVRFKKTFEEARAKNLLEDFCKKHAEEFKRDFGRWLKDGHQINIESIVTHDGTVGGYRLVSQNWHPTEPVRNYSEASLVNEIPQAGMGEEIARDSEVD
jgi:hypothetical protein